MSLRFGAPVHTRHSFRSLPFSFALLARSAEPRYVSGWPSAMGCNPTPDGRRRCPQMDHPAAEGDWRGGEARRLARLRKARPVRRLEAAAKANAGGYNSANVSRVVSTPCRSAFDRAIGDMLSAGPRLRIWGVHPMPGQRRRPSKTDPAAGPLPKPLGCICLETIEGSGQLTIAWPAGFCRSEPAKGFWTHEIFLGVETPLSHPVSGFIFRP